MNTFIALLRGVNVGGKNKLPMADLRTALSESGLHAVKTYIQSGNVVFQSALDDQSALSATITDTLQQRFAISTTVMLMTAAHLRSVRDANPFPDAENLDKALQLYFLQQSTQKPDHQKLASLQADTESYHLQDNCFYLLAPDGIGRSKLAAGAERCLGVGTTTRNWRSVNKLIELAS